MNHYIRNLVLDFSRATCRDGLYKTHNNALIEANDFVNRIKDMVENKSRDCLELYKMYQSTDLYSYFSDSVSFRDFAESFSYFDKAWMKEVVEVENIGTENERDITNAEYHPNIVYLKRSADAFIEAYDALDTTQQLALGYVIKPYAQYAIPSVTEAAKRMEVKPRSNLGCSCPI